MKIFKFGGASVKDANGVRNLAKILAGYSEPKIVVVSAMGKMTNALEKVLEAYMNKNHETREWLDEVFRFHDSVMKDLFDDSFYLKVRNQFKSMFEGLHQKIHSQPSLNYHYEYDQMVSFGELFSTFIISAYLQEKGIQCKWMDIRHYLKSDDQFRDANINYDLSQKYVQEAFDFSDTSCYITQGFLASTINNLTTTLGREGSDFTAAVLAYLLDIEEVTILKDVSGILNADPKWMDDTIKLERISYDDSIELAYYGASVVHPKTIQPLKRKNIVLYVKSFINPDEPGTLVCDSDDRYMPCCFVRKTDQVLLKIATVDFSFMAEKNLQKILGCFAQAGLKVNIMQNTAVQFDVCVNNDKFRIEHLLALLTQDFDVEFIRQVEIITLYYYNAETLERIRQGKEILLEQRTPKTALMVVKTH
ncbi:MAG: aspartate kinase [Bacteroidetes bacterium]|nr:aspartate kinase [Bacteroidota bacterium]